MFLIVLLGVLLAGFGSAFFFEGRNDFVFVMLFIVTVFLFIGLVLGKYVF